MHPFAALPLTFLLISPIVTFLSNPPPIPEGNKVAGWVNDFPAVAPYSDFLTTTLCYCQRAHQVDTYDEGHHYRHDYYNYHKNTTFFLSHTCLSNHANGYSCLTPRSQGRPATAGAQQYDRMSGMWYKDFGSMVCEQWDRTDQIVIPVTDVPPHEPPRPRRRSLLDRALRRRIDYGSEKDALCISINPGGSIFQARSIIFNGQMRYLGQWEGQGRRDAPFVEVGSVCQEICERETGMDVLEGGGTVVNQQMAWVDLDDMCDTCA